MSIREKILLIFVVSFVMLVLVLFAVSHLFLMDKFAVLESRDMKQNVLRLLDALGNDRMILNQKLSDWGNWDDTYRFVEDGNSGYIKSNLAETTYQDLKINMMLFLNKKGAA